MPATSDLDVTALNARVTGTVQGVGFRWFTRETAAAHGVSGWVRNRFDGSVEAELHGPDRDVAAVLSALREGPPHAVVDRIATTPIPVPPRRPHGFEIRATV